MDQDLQYIDKFLLGEMAADEQTAFKKKMASDPAFANKVAEQQETIAYIKALADQKIKEEIAAIPVDVDEVWNDENENTATSNIKPINQWKPTYTYLLATASVALLLGLSILFMQKTESTYAHLANAAYEPHSVSTRSDEEGNKAQQLYRSGAYQKAISKLQQLKKDDPEYGLMLGISYYELEDFDKAIQEFEALIDNKNRLLLDKARWYAALTYLQLNEPQKTRQHLDLIVANQKDAGEELTAKAKDLLKDLDK